MMRMSSGDDIQAGRPTTAEKTTCIIGAVPTGTQYTPFNGDTIFKVLPQSGALEPRETLNGIFAAGNSQNTPRNIPGGIGVIGQGGVNKGTGVLGRGGANSGRDARVGIGVIGLAGDTPIPPIPETDNIGVYGKGPIGVEGHGFYSGISGKSEVGSGVYGSSDNGNGGVFVSYKSAQLWLQPQFRALGEDKRSPKLPKSGLCGEIMSVQAESGNCSLWFCVQRNDDVAGTPARWAQILLGNPIDGQE